MRRWLPLPDWSYQTVLRPLLFRLEAERARDLTLGAMGQLARLPGGPGVIELMGHMAPPEGLHTSLAGIQCLSPVGLAAGLDPGVLGLAPLSQFGFGYIEIGPVTAVPLAGQPVRRMAEQEAIWYPDVPVNLGLTYVRERLRHTVSRVPVGIRLAHRPGASPLESARERFELILALQEHAAFFTLETRGGADLSWTEADWRDHVMAVTASSDRPILVCLAPDIPHERALMLMEGARSVGASGAIISGGVAGEGGRLEGRPARAPSLALLRSMRDRFGPSLPIVAGGAIIEPADVWAFREAGATMVHLHAGFVYSGPGLPKRVNELLLWEQEQAAAERLSPQEQAVQTAARGRGWLGALLMAFGILTGAALATWIALTSVVLPYDERFVGLSRAALSAINPRLLAFMQHDRISLSGTMGASAILYLFIAWYPWRRGEHWARPAFIFPATLGFLNFLLYPIYGYFEPLHALFYALLLPFFTWAVCQRPTAAAPAAMLPDRHDDRVWRIGQWGQLLWIALGAAGAVGGLTITLIGLTRVFVPEDLGFMQTTADILGAVPRLVPLVAHDRVGFGTTLVCNGLTVLLMALWGYRRGARWLWWAFFAAGIPSYVAAFGTHLAIGYTNLWHLTPPLAGLVVLLAALACSYRYLTESPQGKHPAG